MSIIIEGLCKNYGAQKAVNALSFAVEKGEIVGFLGPNGAGKSTTMKMITGYLTPDAGNAIVCGINVAANPIAVKQKIGYLPESNPLYLDMYVREYLQFIAGVHQIKAIKKAIDNVIELTGLTLECHKKTGQLSKGYKQRVGLAAALIHNPEVLVLDEPTTGLDPNQIVEIRNVIKQQSHNKTILFSSHILQEVQAICDRVIIINKGQIVANDSVANLQQSHRQGHVVKVTFQEPVAIAWLQQIAEAQTVEQLGNSYFELGCTNPSQVKKQLLELSLQHNLNIVSLQTEGASLEEVFKALTANK